MLEEEMAGKIKNLAAELGELTLEIGELSQELREKQVRANNIATALKELKKDK